jgi:septum formation protein
VLKNSQGKVKTVAPRHPNAIILGVDTVVFHDGQILEKPKDAEDAFRMLKAIQGSTHTVFTAQVLLDTGTQRQLESVDQTAVTVLPMTDEQIRTYIATGEPMDKAGAYAAQGIGAQFIQKIDGDFFNVVGLSVSRFMALYTQLDQSE